MLADLVLQVVKCSRYIKIFETPSLSKDTFLPTPKLPGVIKHWSHSHDTEEFAQTQYLQYPRNPPNFQF
jgi:hypothetical protein